MHDSDSTTHEGSLCSVIDAAENLCAVTSYRIARNGLIFEHSGESMAVFDGEFRIDRVDLPSSDDYAFQRAIDLWLLNRYMAEAR